MRILLLSPPYLPEYMRNARCDFVSLSATQWYPILLGHCGAYLQSLGHRVNLVDAPAHHLDHEKTRRLIRRYRPDLLVLYTGSQSEKNDLAFGDSIVEEMHCDAVIVGPFASIHPEKTLSRAQGIDKLVTGEFDRAVARIASNDAPGRIDNLLFRENDLLVRNPEGPYMNREELNSVPFVSRFLREQLRIHAYRTPSEYHPFMDVMTGRGCQWGRCTYCLWVHTFIRGPVYNTRSLEGVIEEFRFIEKDIPEVRSVMIQDDTLTKERAEAFSEAKLRAGIRLPWSCYARGNLPRSVLELMKRAGCRNLHVGYESADPAVLKRIRKGLTVEQMTRFTRDAKRSNLRIHGDFAIGFPGETPRSARKTWEWACRLRPHTAQFQLMIPFPATPYHREMAEKGWLNEEGRPHMPYFSNDQIRAAAKQAYRRFYLHPRYALQCCLHPQEQVLGRLKTIRRALPAMFWKRWQV